MKTRELEVNGLLDLWVGVKTALLAIVVTVLLVPAYVYSIFYAIYRGCKLDDWKAPFRFIWSLINGTLSVFGWLFYQIGVFLDYLWNIWGGEAIEDMVTTREKTNFSKSRITVSSSCGREKLDGFYIEKREWFSRLVNRVFGQRNHFIGAEKVRLAKLEIEEQDFYDTIEK